MLIVWSLIDSHQIDSLRADVKALQATKAPIPVAGVIETDCAAWLYQTDLASAKARMCGKP